jgi:ligand-binding sensor domain-containing protein
MMNRSLLSLGMTLLTLSLVDSAFAQQPSSSPFQSQAASIQALTMVGSDILYAGSFGLGVFRSEDRGASWTKSSEGVSDPFILSLATAKDGTVYVGTFRGGVFRTTDQGKTWHPVNAGLKRKEVKTLLAAGDLLYAGTADGAYRLNTSDDHWRVVTSGLDEILVHALAESADGTLYAGTSGKGVLKFKANTTGWVRLHDGLKVWWRILFGSLQSTAKAGSMQGPLTAVFSEARTAAIPGVRSAVPCRTIPYAASYSTAVACSLRRGTAFSRPPTRAGSGCR